MTSPTSGSSSSIEVKSYHPLAINNDTNVFSLTFNYTIRFIVDRVAALVEGIYFTFRVVYDFLSVFGHLSVTLIKLPLSLIGDWDMNSSVNESLRHLILTAQYAVSATLFLSVGWITPYGVRYLKHHFINSIPTWTNLNDDRVIAYEAAVALSTSARDTCDSLNKSVKALSSPGEVTNLISTQETAKKALELFSECEEAFSTLCDYTSEKDQLIHDANELLATANQLNNEIAKREPPPPTDQNGDSPSEATKTITVNGPEKSSPPDPSPTEGDYDEVDENNDIVPDDPLMPNSLQTPQKRTFPGNKKFQPTLSPIPGTPATPMNRAPLTPASTPEQRALKSTLAFIGRLAEELKKTTNPQLIKGIKETIEREKLKLKQLNE